MVRSWAGMISYLNGGGSPDYRGGLSYTRTIGASIAAEHGGRFFKTTADSVYVSRFQNDLLNYSQNELGYTFVPAKKVVAPSSRRSGTTKHYVSM